MRFSRRAPRAATPIATPPMRNVLLIPDAMPVRAGSTTRNAPAASARFERPIPTPATISPGKSLVQLESDETSSRINTSPTDTRANPAVTITHNGVRAARRRVAIGTMNTNAVIGRNRRPAPSGESPRRSCR